MALAGKAQDSPEKDVVATCREPEARDIVATADAEHAVLGKKDGEDAVKREDREAAVDAEHREDTVAGEEGKDRVVAADGDHGVRRPQ